MMMSELMPQSPLAAVFLASIFLVGSVAVGGYVYSARRSHNRRRRQQQQQQQQHSPSEEEQYCQQMGGGSSPYPIAAPAPNASSAADSPARNYHQHCLRQQILLGRREEAFEPEATLEVVETSTRVDADIGLGTVSFAIQSQDQQRVNVSGYNALGVIRHFYNRRAIFM